MLMDGFLTCVESGNDIHNTYFVRWKSCASCMSLFELLAVPIDVRAHNIPQTTTRKVPFASNAGYALGYDIRPRDSTTLEPRLLSLSIRSYRLMLSMEG